MARIVDSENVQASVTYFLGWIRNKEWIQCCLDRALGNSEFFALFPRVQAEVLERFGSYHCPMFLRLANENVTRTSRFMFDKRWLEKPEVLEIVRNGWGYLDGSKSLVDRISDCRRALSKWKHTTNTNSKTRIKRLREKLEA